ncbi:MAG TPA: NAD(P)-dependent oxidoreductase [Candidatus Paceibacterota bacterium]
MITSTDKLLITGASGFIGTNLLELFEKKNYIFVNFDKSPPSNKEHDKYWFKGNLLYTKSIKEAFEQFKPTIIIHLAARTDCDSNIIDDYIDNTKGTQNLIDCIKEFDTIKQVIITSTQYVYKSKDKPFQLADDDYLPHTTYGESKVITEKITRGSNLKCVWTIVRPTNVWGPWHMRYPNELWKMIDKGFYIHASRHPVIRTYAYVKNVVHQINEIINASVEKVDKKTFYLGDLPIDSYIWLNEISKQLRNKAILRVSSSLFIIPALIGDLLKKIGISFPIYSSRFKNMIEDYYAPTNVTIHEFGLSNLDMKDNVQETIKWIKDEGVSYFPYWKMKNHGKQK